MKNIITLALALCLQTVSAQVSLDFNTQQLPTTWTSQGSFAISNAAIHPICQQNALIGSFFTPSTDSWLQTDIYSYGGNDVTIYMTYGIKDLYHALGVSSPFQKPELFLEYAEGNSNTWIVHEEISLTNLTQSSTCLTYSTTISASDLSGFQSVKYRFVYKSPAQTGTLYLLYWSLDQLDIQEITPTPCTPPQFPQAQNYQAVPAGTTLADLIVIGQNLKWYSDTGLTTEIPDTTTVADMETYYVTQTVNGCESQPLAIEVHVQVLSLNKLHIEDLNVYPNPTKDILNISAKKEISEIEIFNLSGQRVLNKKNSIINSVDLSAFPRGNYILKVRSGKNQKTFKVVKQ